jgi:peptide/nickel transport system substrate-binding protein
MAEDSNFWLARRLNRRRALGAGVVGVGFAAAGLAGCGTSNNNKSGSTAPKPAATTRGLITEATGTPVASLTTGKPGGTLSFQMPSAPGTIDPYTQTSYLNAYVDGLVYSQLYGFKAGRPGVQPADSTVEPDLAAALPETPDKTTMTIKLKPAKWHNQPPVNGRALTSEDVKYAFDRYQNSDKSVHKSFWLFLDSIQTPDPQTVTLKFKFPYADAVQVMGGNLGNFLSPKEFAETPDAATKMLGSGPFMFVDYQNNTSFSFKKNPDFYNKPFPYFDEVKGFVVTDTAKRVADFSAKSVDYTWLFLPDDRDQIKKNRPDAGFQETQGIGGYIYLRADKPPFNDKRVRQALSMAIDRKAIRDATSKGEGVDDQALFVGNAGWAKQVKDLGAAAKYWTHDVQAAKQLLAAAGNPTIEANWSHADAAVYTQVYVDTATLTQAQWKDIGVKINDVQQPYPTYISTTYAGNYEGFGHSPRAVPYYQDTLSDQFYWDSAKGRARINLSYVNDPILNDLLDKQRAEFDIPARQKIISDIEALIAEQQYQIYWSTDTRTYFWNPALANISSSGFFPYRYMQWWYYAK